MLSLLNHFYSVVDQAIVDNDGEILKFIGDGVLAIFPILDEPNAELTSAKGALAAVAQSRKNLSLEPAEHGLDFRASLHIGKVFYGNIGSGDRLDFTAIGPTVNLASRMLTEASNKGARTVCSTEFKNVARDLEARPIDCHFKGFLEPTRVFVLE